MSINDKAVRVGRTYAQAVFELAEQSQLVDVLKNDLDVLANLTAQSEEFETLMVSPSFHDEHKKQIVGAVFSGKLNELTINFLMVVIEHNRMKFLLQIIASYNELWEEYHGCHRVKVIVSKAMDKAETERLTRSIAAAINGRVMLEVIVNPSIIGGITIRYGDKLIDNSIRNKLQLVVKEVTKRRELHGV
jgi:F-type H+-transporting ATPase subunit delta